MSKNFRGFRTQPLQKSEGVKAVKKKKKKKKKKVWNGTINNRERLQYMTQRFISWRQLYKTMGTMKKLDFKSKYIYIHISHPLCKYNRYNEDIHKFRLMRCTVAFYVQL